MVQTRLKQPFGAFAPNELTRSDRMYVIRPETRYAWKQVLTDEYAYDKDTAQQVVDFVAANPEIAEATPRNVDELHATLDTVEETIDDLQLDSFGNAEAHHEVREELLSTLENHLQLDDGGSSGFPEIGAGGGVALAKKNISDEPPAFMEDWIDVLVEEIEDDVSPWEREDLDELVARIENQLED